MTDDPLQLDPETMRQLGYLTVDWLVDRERRRREEPVITQATPSQMRARLDVDAPPEGDELQVILEELAEQVLPFRSRIDHPRYLAYVPGSGTWPGALGDLVASTFNIDVGNWVESSGPTQLELTVLSWFAAWIGYPPTSRGVLVSGGSAANLTGLACAREAMVGSMREDLVVYVSDQGHSSLARAARVLGFRPEQVRVLPADSTYRMRLDSLESALEADIAAGRRPLAVLAVAGTTNTGAVDRLPEIAEICRRRGVWLHVDAAYGGFAAVTERGRSALTGLDLADSVTLDPHKWLYQPFECGALLVRAGHLLREAFEIHPDYLQDSRARDEQVNFADHGLQLTRMSRALKVWMSVRYFGLGSFRTAVDRCLDHAERTQRYVEDSDAFELMAPATLGIVCFRRRVAGADEERLERVNAALVTALSRTGLGMVSSTRLLGRYALRICVLNHETGWEDVKEVLEWLAAADTTDEDRPAEAATQRDVTGGWPLAPGAVTRGLRGLALLDGVDERWVEWVATVGRLRRMRSGETVVRQWDVNRDFYLLLAGDADVVAGGKHLTTMHAGDFFGELAALDWGASFGYPRLADVAARTDLELLVLTDAQLHELMAAVPAVDARIRAAAAVRLRRG